MIDLSVLLYNCIIKPGWMPAPPSLFFYFQALSLLCIIHILCPPISVLIYDLKAKATPCLPNHFSAYNPASFHFCPFLPPHHFHLAFLSWPPSIILENVVVSYGENIKIPFFSPLIMQCSFPNLSFLIYSFITWGEKYIVTVRRWFNLDYLQKNQLCMGRDMYLYKRE